MIRSWLGLINEVCLGSLYIGISLLVYVHLVCNVFTNSYVFFLPSLICMLLIECFALPPTAKPQIYYPSDSTLYLTPQSPLSLKCKDEEGIVLEWLFEGKKINQTATGFSIVKPLKDENGKIVSYAHLSKDKVDYKDAGDYTCTYATDIMSRTNQYQIRVQIVKGNK